MIACRLPPRFPVASSSDPERQVFHRNSVRAQLQVRSRKFRSPLAPTRTKAERSRGGAPVALGTQWNARCWRWPSGIRLDVSSDKGRCLALVLARGFGKGVAITPLNPGDGFRSTLTVQRKSSPPRRNPCGWMHPIQGHHGPNRAPDPLMRPALSQRGSNETATAAPSSERAP